MEIIHNYKPLPNEDAYGNNIYESFISGVGGYDIVERDDGKFTLNGDSDAYTEDYKHWSAIQKAAAKRVNGKILDVGCGGGKHSIYFQSKGFDVTGMDNSVLALKVCELRGLKKGLLCDVASFHHSLVKDLDCVLMMGNNLGLVQNRDLLVRFFKELNLCTNSKGKILVESLDPEGPAFKEDRIYIENNKRNGRMPGQIRVRIRYKHFCTSWTDYLFLGINELKRILDPGPWFVSKVWEDHNIGQYIAELGKIKR